MIAYEVRTTLHAKFGLAMAVMMVLILALIATGGFFETLPDSVAGLDGLLLTAHLWLVVSLASMQSCQLAKAFLREREDEPLLAHPAVYPALARHHFFTSITFVSLAFIGLFFIYFWQPLTSRLDNLWLTIPTHLAAICLLVFVSATLTGGLARMLLRAATARGFRDANLFVNVTGGAAMATLMIVLLGIIIANKHAVALFEALGNSLGVLASVGMIPFASALAVGEGDWLTAAGCLGVLTGLSLWGLRASYRWSFTAHQEIPIDLAAPSKHSFVPLFTGRPVRWLPGGLSAFWRKDIVVPCSREPKRYLLVQVSLLWWGILALILAVALKSRGIISPAFADTIPVLITLLAMASIAMQNGVNALGREGNELVWLRPIFSGRQLLGLKLAVNWFYVFVHGVAYALVIIAAANTALLDTSRWVLLLYALGAGSVFSCMATAIGFLLPDFTRRRSALPGSTAVGKIGYVFAALVLITFAGTAHLLVTAGAVGPATCLGLFAYAGVSTAAATALISVVAIRQYQGMEI
jgi:hypothetical protein